MVNLRGFASKMRRLGRRVEKNSPKVARFVALAVDQAVVTATPVDTGRARSNWFASVGAPRSGVSEAYVPGSGGSTGAANTAEAITQATAATRGLTREGQSIYITNNLPYIGRLNQGSSAQAPAGFVEQGVKAGVNKLREIKILPRDL